MSVDLNNLLQYQRQFHQNLTTKSAKRTNSAKAVAQTDELFATPGEIIKRSELEYERAIQRQRETTIGTGLSKPPERPPTTPSGDTPFTFQLAGQVQLVIKFIRRAGVNQGQRGMGLVGVDGGDDVGSDPIPTPNAHRNR